MPRPLANSSFFVLHSSFTKANIEPFTRAAKNRVSVTSKNLLTKSGIRVNKNNALIFNAKTDVFVRRKRYFPFCGAARAFLRLYELRSGRRLFAQDCVSVFSGWVSIRSGKSLSVQVKWAYRGVTCDNCDK